MPNRAFLPSEIPSELERLAVELAENQNKLNELKADKKVPRTFSDQMLKRRAILEVEKEVRRVANKIVKLSGGDPKIRK